MNHPTKKQITRTGRLLGGYVPAPVAAGIRAWIEQGEERNVSTFLREAAREKLRREGIPLTEAK